MFDRIEKLHGSLVQYGPYNDRIYLMKLNPDDLPGLVSELHALCTQHDFSKVFAKVPGRSRTEFVTAGYLEEAVVPGMVNGEDDAVFLSLYVKEARAVEREPERVQKNLELAHAKATASADLNNGPPIEETTPDDAVEMADVYKKVFASYPFPIHDPAYLVETMASHIRYFCVRDEGRIVALSSAEMDLDSTCVEMTDFATLPDARGRGLAVVLLDHMEKAMRQQAMLTSYTIARSLSAGMNITFAKAGYEFAGTLINNTNISGQIESMNVWYKPLTSTKMIDA